MYTDAGSPRAPGTGSLISVNTAAFVGGARGRHMMYSFRSRYCCKSIFLVYAGQIKQYRRENHEAVLDYDALSGADQRSCPMDSAASAVMLTMSP